MVDYDKIGAGGMDWWNGIEYGNLKLKNIITIIISINNTMSFNANIDVAISFTTLKMCSIRQQGLLKFRLCLFHEINNPDPTQSNKSQNQTQIIFCHPYSIMRQEKQKKHMGLSVTSNLAKNSDPYKNGSMNIQNFHQHSQPPKQKGDSMVNPNFHKIPTSSRLPPANEQKNSHRNESELDLESQFYYSKNFQVLHEKQTHSIMETCCFRTYIDTQHFQTLQLKCLVQILFCPQTLYQETNAFRTIARCECKVRKIFDVSTYFPIVFDEFDGVTLEGIYQASLMDFRFEKNQHQYLHSINSFFDYLKSVTNSFKRFETREFYKFYRGILEKQLIKIQERHYDLLRVLNLLKRDEDFRRIRMNPNSNVHTMIDHLEGYNQHSYNNPLQSQKQIKRAQSINNGGIYYKNKSGFSRSFTSVSTESMQILSYEEQLCQEILKDLLSVKAQIFQKWTQFLQFTQQNLKPITERYKNNYNILVKERLSGNVFSHRIINSDWKKSAYDDSGMEHKKQAQLDKKKIEKDEQLWKQTFPVDNETYFLKDNKSIKIFEEVYEVNRQPKNIQKLTSRSSMDLNMNSIYYKNNEQVKNLRKSTVPESSYETLHSNCSFDTQNEDHYVVLVHGYQASRQDFLLFKNCLQIKFKVKVYISTCNEGRTQDAIEVMGKRLAIELQSFLNKSQRSINYKLSFIGHSMGGIIIRTALCYLQNIDRHLHTFITFSTPHLGYLYNPSAHIQAGLWFMNTWQKSDSIEELSMRDNEDLRNCFMYKLNRSGSMNSFKHMAFVGSIQDKYAPYESARLEQNQTFISDKLSSSNGRVLRQMIEGALGNIKCTQFSRMDIIFNIEDSNLDSMIGRTGHVKFLSDRQFIKIFCIVFDKYFR